MVALTFLGLQSSSANGDVVGAKKIVCTIQQQKLVLSFWDYYFRGPLR